MNLWKIGTWRLGTWLPGVWPEELGGLLPEIKVAVSVRSAVVNEVGGSIFAISAATPEIGVRQQATGLRAVLKAGNIEAVTDTPRIVLNKVGVSQVSVIVESRND